MRAAWSLGRQAARGRVAGAWRNGIARGRLAASAAASASSAASGSAAAVGAAAFASVAFLALAEGPVLAKQRSEGTRQQVFVWGRVQSIPGGAPGDVLWPRRIEWFEKNEAGWQNISFGPDFGCALDRAGVLYVWGEGEDGDSVGPVAIDLQGPGRGRRFVDAQCSSDKIIALTSRGQVYMISGVHPALTERARAVAPPGEAAEGDEAAAPPSAAAVAAAAALAKAPLPLVAEPMPGVPSPGRLSSLFGGGGVKQMGIGLEHAAFVTRRGELYTVGGNEWGQCGIRPPKQKGIMGAVEERSRVEVMTPTRVEFPPDAGPIVDVAVGGRHTLAKDKDGRTYAFGDDRRIQLGLGDTRSQGTDERNSFGVIRQEVLGGRDTKQNVKRMVTYRYYDPHMQYHPMKTIEPEAYNRPPYPPPSFIACGEDFTVAIHRDSPDWFSKEQETNVLICTGENGEGQCGRGLQEQQQAWTPVRMPKRSRTVALACGQAHCLALLTTGDLYSWGASLQGQLGNGKRATKAKPTKVGLQPPEGSKVETKNMSAPGDAPMYQAVGPDFTPFPGRIVSLSCGFRNSAVICEVPASE